MRTVEFDFTGNRGYYLDTFQGFLYQENHIVALRHLDFKPAIENAVSTFIIPAVETMCRPVHHAGLQGIPYDSMLQYAWFQDDKSGKCMFNWVHHLNKRF